MDWYDGHLDLSSLALEGRDLALPLEEARGGPQPPAVTFSTLERGRVRYANATIFTAPNFKEPWGYPRGDLAYVHRLGWKQLQQYQQWEASEHLRIVRYKEDLEAGYPLSVVLLMEGADPITTPEQLDLWYEAGLRIIGLSWSTGTRYAGGNHTKGPLSPSGRELLQAMEARGMIHDFSHLSDESAYAVLEQTKGPIVASHSNSRAVIGNHKQRHLSDDLIRQISARDGVIGINLYSKFLIPDGNQRRATIDETVAHIEHICEVMKRRDRIALGSDMDGGFGADKLPDAIHEPKDYEVLWEALRKRGWSATELSGFAQENWLQFMRTHLPMAPVFTGVSQPV